MVRPIMRDVVFLNQKSEPATKAAAQPSKHSTFSFYALLNIPDPKQNLFQYGRIQFINQVFSIPAAAYKLRFLQNIQMLADGRRGHIKVLRDAGGRHSILLQEIEDLPAGRI